MLVRAVRVFAHERAARADVFLADGNRSSASANGAVRNDGRRRTTTLAARRGEAISISISTMSTMRTRAMYVVVNLPMGASAEEDEAAAKALLDDGTTLRLRFRRARGSGQEAREGGAVMTVNGREVVHGQEAVVTLRREREGCFVSMDEVTFADDFEYELTWEREMWATGRGRRNDADDSWTMTMSHASLSRTMSLEAERASPKAPKSCEVELAVVGAAKSERMCLVNHVSIPIEKIIRPRRRGVPTVVGETSAILPVIDEHSHGVNAATVIVEATKVANHSHNAHISWKAPSILGGGEMDNLAMLGRMRQRYESMMEYQDEYPEGTKLSWFDASLRLGIGVGLGTVLGLGLGVGVVVNGFRRLGAGRLPATRKSKEDDDAL